MLRGFKKIRICEEGKKVEEEACLERLGMEKEGKGGRGGVQRLY